MSFSTYLEFQVTRPTSALDPDFFDDMAQSEMNTSQQKSAHREDYLSSSAYAAELEDEQLMLMQQQQQPLRPYGPPSSSSNPYNQQHPLSPARSIASSASTASLVSQRSTSNKGAAGANDAAGAGPSGSSGGNIKKRHKRSNSSSSNSSTNSINMRMQVSFDEETELLQEELGYDFLAGKDVLSGRGQKVKVLNTHYRDLIRKYHPEYVAAGFGGKRRKLAESICNQIFQKGGRFLDFKGHVMTEQQCQQKIMKALKDFSKKGKSSSSSASASTSKATGVTSSKTPTAGETNSSSSTGIGNTKGTRRSCTGPSSTGGNDTGARIVSPPTPKRPTLPSSLEEMVEQQQQQIQRQPTPTPTSSICSRPTSTTPSMLMLESDDDVEGPVVEVSSSSSNDSVVGTNNDYYFDHPPPLASDVPVYDDEESTAAVSFDVAGQPQASQQQPRKNMAPPAPALVDVSQTSMKRQKMSHPTTPAYYYQHQPPYQYQPHHPHHLYQQHQQHVYAPQQQHYQRHQHYEEQQHCLYDHPYAILNREMLSRLSGCSTSATAAPPPPRRVTMPMASSHGMHQHQFRAPSPSPFSATVSNNSHDRRPHDHHQPVRQVLRRGSGGDGIENNNGNDIEPLPLSIQEFALDDATVQEMLGGLVAPDEYL